MSADVVQAATIYGGCLVKLLTLFACANFKETTESDSLNEVKIWRHIELKT